MREPYRSLVAAALLLAAAAPVARAQSLPLPAEAWTLAQALAEHCPDCEKSGFYACGTNEVGYGQRFAANLFAGTPKRGYLVSFSLTGREFAETIRREADYGKLLESLRERFRQSRLVVVDENFASARVLGPGQVQLIVSEPLHQCLRHQDRADSAQGECNSDECCDKAHGAPKIEIAWADPESRESLRFRFGRTAGETRLLRQVEGRTQTYFCLNDSRGRLR